VIMLPIDEDILRSKISEINFAISELLRLTSKPFVQLSIDEKYSIRYNLIILVESLVSLCMHIAVEAYAKTPLSYREAVKFVTERLSVSCTRDLEALVGLRNILVHRYWTVMDEKVYESIKNDFKCIHELIGKVREVFRLEN